MKLTTTTSAHTPADGYVLPGCIALVSHLYAQRADVANTLLLLRLIQDDDHELYEEEVQRFLGLSSAQKAWNAMTALKATGWCELHEDRDFQFRITLTEEGQLEALAIFGAVMLAGTDAH